MLDEIVANFNRLGCAILCLASEQVQANQAGPKPMRDRRMLGEQEIRFKRNAALQTGEIRVEHADDLFVLLACRNELDGRFSRPHDPSPLFLPDAPLPASTACA